MLAKRFLEKFLDGTMKDANDHLEGIYKGYHVILGTFQKTQYAIHLNAHSVADPENAKLLEYAQYQKANNTNIISVSVNAHSIVYVLKIYSHAAKMAQVVNEVVKPLVNYLLLYEYVSGCENCGSTVSTLHCYAISNQYHFVCESCSKELQTELKEQKVQDKKLKSALIPGIVGAILGSLIGCVIWVLILQLGDFAGFAGLVTGVCAMLGYKKFGGNLDAKGIVASIIIVIIMISFANKFGWAWSAYAVLKEYDWSFAECYQNLDYILAEWELEGDYATGLMIGYILTLGSSFATIRSAVKRQRGKYRVKKSN